jgi:hypothetical protein
LAISGRRPEAVFAADPHLAGAAGVLHLADPPIGRRPGDLLVLRVAEVLALVLDRPKTVVLDDGQDRPIWNHAHGQSLTHEGPEIRFFEIFIAIPARQVHDVQIKYRFGSLAIPAEVQNFSFGNALDPLRKFDLKAHLGRENSCPEKDNENDDRYC